MRIVALLLLLLCCLGCRVFRHEADRHIGKVAEQKIEEVVQKTIGEHALKLWPVVSTGVLGLLSAGLGMKIRALNGKLKNGGNGHV